MNINETSLNQIAEIAIEATLEAGDYISSRFGGDLTISSKSGKTGQDLVTDVDKKSQKIIEEIICKRFPNHTILGEEDSDDKKTIAEDWVWAIDPIDGTNNYVNTSQHHAVSVAAMHKGYPMVGVIWVPWANDSGNGLLMHAAKGSGTWINGKRIEIEIDDIKPVRGRLSGLPWLEMGNFKLSKAIMSSLGEVRIFGSTAYELFMVANGSMQFSLTGFANTWDFAAGILLVEESGGKVLWTNNTNKFEKFTGWAQPYSNSYDTYKNLREWKGAVLVGSKKLVNYLSKNIKINISS